MELTYTDVYSYIEGRCSRYGLTLEDGLSMTHPEVLDNASPKDLYNHWQQKQISHIFSQESHPWLKGDVSNCFLEDASPNASRQDNPATDTEVADAWDDQISDWIDQDYNDNMIPDYMESEVTLDLI